MFRMVLYLKDSVNSENRKDSVNSEDGVFI